MRQFDGRKPMVEKLSMGRTWMFQMIDTIGMLEDMPEEHREGFVGYLEKSFPKEWIEEVGLDPVKLEELVRENIEYLYCAPGEYNHVLDPLLQDLGLSNRSPEFLVYLEKELADYDPNGSFFPINTSALAARYLGEHGTDLEAALQYLRENRGKLFFSDSGGFRWLVRPAEFAVKKQ